MKHVPVNGPHPYAWDVLVKLDVKGGCRDRRVVTVITDNRGDAVRLALETPLATRVLDIEGMTREQYRMVYGARGHKS
jgi:hypothetical protein